MSRLDTKLRRISELEAGKFADMVGEVIKTYPANFDSLDIYVTDYTENQDLFYYQDPSEMDLPPTKPWPGPYGQMTLQIRLFEPHASFARQNIREGDLVHIQNIHVKYSAANQLEGAVHQDRRFIDRINIRKISRQDQIQPIRKLKAEYFRRRLSRSATITVNEPKKPSAKASAKKKEEKKERQRMQKEQEQKELEERAKTRAAARAGINPHIRAGASEIQLSTISEIINNPALKQTHRSGNVTTLPFVNAKYRTHVRVVDFSPGFLEQFTQSMANPAWNPAVRNGSPGNRMPNDRWEWAFVLLVEDANVPAGSTPERLRLFVSGQDAEVLLGGLKAVYSLKEYPEAVDKLEEKLFIIWGNLFELKGAFRGTNNTLPLPCGDERLQNTPFECCVEEYGKRLAHPTPIHPQGWQRTHRLFKTQILDSDSSDNSD
ncbi:uncharacterized protein BDR25DRAFT_238065 [Lindgomyces ingoldianus]|uniref:Uncharacterized protein n=1 Tax=Lindgomyces ingoldianus TaxID=673940 RepID=A0ACB6QIC2_9PLEO|nr:uncharacterized protein BDR25DRAFT_238065 [Lindgomyces ingoldianus]KAF2466077.1 hypothetical protein BDR25DRAFT_238065 [Lindgomyces ingoldianus]